MPRGDAVRPEDRERLRSDPRAVRLPPPAKGEVRRACDPSLDRSGCWRPATWRVDGRGYCMLHAAWALRR